MTIKSSPALTFALLLILSIFLLSCSKDSSVNSNQGSSDQDSLLTYMSRVQFVYEDNDDLPDKMYYPIAIGDWADTTWLYYGTDKKLSRLITQWAMPVLAKTAVFCVYQGEKLAKVYAKRPAYYDQPEYNDVSYFTTLNGIGPDQVEEYDSLAYDAQGRIAGVYHFNTTLIPPGFTLAEYETLAYHASGPYAGELYSVYRYALNPNNGTYPFANKIFFNEYEMGKMNPLYKAFKEYALVRLHWHVRFYMVQPVDDGRSELDDYLSLTPHALHKIQTRHIGLSGYYWITDSLLNKYNAASKLVESSWRGLNGTFYVPYKYGN